MQLENVLNMNIWMHKSWLIKLHISNARSELYVESDQWSVDHWSCFDFDSEFWCSFAFGAQISSFCPSIPTQLLVNNHIWSNKSETIPLKRNLSLFIRKPPNQASRARRRAERSTRTGLKQTHKSLPAPQSGHKLAKKLTARGFF